MSITYILTPSLLLYLFVVLVIGDAQSALYLFFQPPDSLEYLNYSESLALTINLILNGSGNYFVTLPYIIPTFFGFSDWVHFYVPLINFAITYFVFRNVELPRTSGYILMLFFMGTTLGISKEFWLFIGISSFYISRGKVILFASAAVARPQILPILVIWRVMIARLSYGALLVVGIFAMYIAYHFGAFNSQVIFKEEAELQQSFLSGVIDFFLSYKFYTFPIGLFLSSIRLLFELVASFFSGNMFGISTLFISASFMWKFGQLIRNRKVRPLLKLLVFFVLLLSVFPFPHSRYLIWLLIAIVVFDNIKYIRTP